MDERRHAKEEEVSEEKGNGRGGMLG